MIRIPSISVPLDATKKDWPRIAAGILRISPDDILSCRLFRRSVDARRKDDVHLVLTLDVSVRGDEMAILRRANHPQTTIIEDPGASLQSLSLLENTPPKRPIVVGSGPAGLFAALMLARAGARPLLIDRGQDAITRRKAVQAFWADGTLDPQSNVQFGEGGAGTFSDGKLTTGIKNPRCRDVLETFVRHGAPEDILWEAKPHIGTDHLVKIVGQMRAEIESLGGSVAFSTQLTGLRIENGTLRGVRLNGEDIETETVLLCIGHSARDTFTMLYDAGVQMEAKPFSIGARIEHPQALVNRSQYGRFAEHPALGAADYKLSAHLKNGRGVYTFCMCPGGVVVAAASEAGGVVTNGMSYFARDGINANSALLVDVKPDDLPSGGPLSGMRFQQKWERLAYEAGGGGYRAPVQRIEDFLLGRASAALGGVSPSYRPGVTPADLRACLPGVIIESMAEGIRQFDRRLHGFALPDALLTGIETRSSSPVRILRDGAGESNIHGLFPAGEGAGYAGGIMSAAVDGIRAAENALEFLRNASSRRTPL